MRQESNEYQLRPAGRPSTKLHRLKRVLLFAVPSAPLLIFLLPQAITVMPEPTDPWYTPYSTPIAVLCAIYVYPATMVAWILGAAPLSIGWTVIALLYTSLIGRYLCRLTESGKAAA